MSAATLGLLLAAGAGRRMGGPKALLPVPGSEQTLSERAVRVLIDGGCEPVIVTIGAAAGDVRALLQRIDQPGLRLVEVPDWDEGMGASLRAGLAAAPDTDAQAALVMLVDLLDVDAHVIERVGADADPTSLARAAYDSVPGHPVLLGRDHWAGVIAGARGDQGARAYFRSHRPTLIECGDLATGRDADTPDDLG